MKKCKIGEMYLYYSILISHIHEYNEFTNIKTTSSWSNETYIK